MTAPKSIAAKKAKKSQPDDKMYVRKIRVLDNTKRSS
jgi:hypothetical protein